MRILVKITYQKSGILGKIAVQKYFVLFHKINIPLDCKNKNKKTSTQFLVEESAYRNVYIWKIHTQTLVSFHEGLFCRDEGDCQFIWKCEELNVNLDH